MDIMVYSNIGRTGLYQMQQLMKYINGDADQMNDELTNLWSLFQSYDVDVLRRRIAFRVKKDRNFYAQLNKERVAYWDSEAYDRYLHKQDKPFSFKELFDWIEKAGLTF